MQQKYFIFIFLTTICFAAAQSTAIERLQRDFINAPTDKSKIEILNSISHEYKSINPHKTIEFATKSYQLSQKTNNLTGKGAAFINIGTAHIILGNYKEALLQFLKAQELYESENILKPNQKIILQGLVKTYGSIGVVFSEQNIFAKALHFNLKALSISEKIKDESTSNNLYNNIGVIYKSEKQYNKALPYFQKALKLQKKLLSKNMAITQTNIANIYLQQNNLQQALEYYQLAKDNLNLNHDARALGEWYNNMGLYYQQKNDFHNAIQNWTNAIKTSESIDDKFGIIGTYLYMAEFYLDQKKLDLALAYTQKANRLSYEINDLGSKVDSEELLSLIYKEKGQTDLAFDHYKNFSIAKDSLVNIETVRKITEISLNYEYEKNVQQQKENYEKKQITLKEAIKTQNIKLTFALISIFFIGGITFILFRKNQFKKRLTLEKELAEYEQKSLHLQMNPHFFFNCLAAISAFILQNDKEEAIKYLSKFSKLMRFTLESSKESLILVDKEIESLQNYLELEQLRFNQKFNFSISKSNTIEDSMCLPPMLVQSLVENAIIHGVIPQKDIGKIEISFQAVNQYLNICITDNGIGIKQSLENKENSMSVHQSMALEIIKKRLRLLEKTTFKKANITFEEPKEHSGTIVKLMLPIQYIEDL